MPKKQKNLKKKVLFNASVVLSGLNSPNGGSAKVLNFAKSKIILGFISEIILDEILRHVDKLNLEKNNVINKCDSIFNITLSPSKDLVEKYLNVTIDEGDAHVLASAEEHKVDYLVTLDKKHLLILKNKINKFKIVTPGELIAAIKPI